MVGRHTVYRRLADVKSGFASPAFVSPVRAKTLSALVKNKISSVRAMTHQKCIAVPR